VMCVAVPEYLSVGLIIEEELDLHILEEIIDSISRTAQRTKVAVVTGDLKVVEKGACDKIFINTSGIGRILKQRRLSVGKIKVGDKIIITGNIAEHGLAVLAKRKELNLGFNLQSDCACLKDLLIPILKKTAAVKFMRDPTRGGVATVLNEIAENSGLGMFIAEKDIPVSRKVRAACELLGIDPLYIANEGVAFMIVEAKASQEILKLLRRHLLGRNAQIVGRVVRKPSGRVILNTVVGTQRILDMLVGEALPRIC